MDTPAPNGSATADTVGLPTARGSGTVPAGAPGSAHKIPLHEYSPKLSQNFKPTIDHYPATVSHSNAVRDSQHEPIKMVVTPAANGSTRVTTGSCVFGLSPSGPFMALFTLVCYFFREVSSLPVGYQVNTTGLPTAERAGTYWLSWDGLALWIILSLIGLILILVVVVIWLCYKLKCHGQCDGKPVNSPASPASTRSSGDTDYGHMSSPSRDAKYQQGSKSPSQQSSSGRHMEPIYTERERLEQKVKDIEKKNSQLKAKWDEVRAGKSPLSAEDNKKWLAKLKQAATRLQNAKWAVKIYDANQKARERSAGTPSPTGSHTTDEQLGQEGQQATTTDKSPHPNILSD